MAIYQHLNEIETCLLTLQQKICAALSSLDGQAAFHTDAWKRPAGGGGRSSILQSGRLFEKVGVNFSLVTDHALPASATTKRPELAGRAFTATGLSIVVHPLNPYVPTTHCNVRFFCTGDDLPEVWWFGGGFDLTPYYGFIEDCQHWHQTAKQACDAFSENSYAQYKKWCDDYFYLPHRQEARGIGGIFFDDLHNPSFEQCFAFVQSVGESFLHAYLPIAEKRQHHAYSERERQFQLYRRGRYVEFNLLYDRGTLFGLQSGGRTESILMSLPPHASWLYDWRPAPDSTEAQLTDFYLVPRDWLQI